MTNQPMHLTNRQKILYFVLTVSSWYACVTLANSSLEILLITVVLVNFISAKKLSGVIDKKLFIKALFIGLGFDQLALSMGIIKIPALPVLPLWLVALWIIFVLSLPFYRTILNGNSKKAAVLGAVFGPLSYWSGKCFDVLEFSSLWFLLLYGVFWAGYMYYFTCNNPKS